MKLVILFFLLFSTAVSAEPKSLLNLDSLFEEKTYLYTGALTWHPFPSDYDYQWKHKLLGVQYDRWVAIYFENSYYEDSFFAGYEFYQDEWWEDIEAGLAIGPTYGYRHCIKRRGKAERRFCAAPFATMKFKQFSGQPVIAILPGAFALTVRWLL